MAACKSEHKMGGWRYDGHEINILFWWEMSRSGSCVVLIALTHRITECRGRVLTVVLCDFKGGGRLCENYPYQKRNGQRRINLSILIARNIVDFQTNRFCHLVRVEERWNVIGRRKGRIWRTCTRWRVGIWTLHLEHSSKTNPWSCWRRGTPTSYYQLSIVYTEVCVCSNWA